MEENERETEQIMKKNNLSRTNRGEEHELYKGCTVCTDLHRGTNSTADQGNNEQQQIQWQHNRQTKMQRVCSDNSKTQRRRHSSKIPATSITNDFFTPGL